MEKLSGQSQGTVALKIHEGGETVTIDRVESRPFRCVDYPVGSRLPLNASSSVKVFLAHMTPEERRALYQAGCFRRFTDRKPRPNSAVRETPFPSTAGGALPKRRGASRRHQGVGAPIFGPADRLQAALTVALPKVLLPDKMTLEDWRTCAESAHSTSLVCSVTR